MNTCDRQNGRRLLEGELSPVEESAMLNHLDGCPRCQTWLEEDAGDDSDWSSTRQLLGSSAEVARWPGSSGGVSALTQPHVRGDELDAPRYPAVDISFLAPSDDPAYVGRIGPYEIAGVIGHGGMGVVLKAVDRSLSRYVAIKVLSPALSGVGAARQRFAREARAMAALSHEHVVPIYAVDEHRGLPYFAMEYVPGGTLQARLSHEGPLEVVAAVRIAMQTALALGAAHDSGLVHRDIKPANILLDRGVERVRVADFGLARTASEASYTASGVLAGTPQFMSPEQVRGEACDGRSDLFSLGSVLYAMCTGHEPFRAENVYSVLQRIVHDQPRSIREQNPAVPAWLERFAARLMAKDRDQRFHTAGEVAEVLARELAHMQNPALIEAPARPWLRRQPWFAEWAPASRNRLVAAVAAAAIALTASLTALWRGEERGPQAESAVAVVAPSGLPAAPEPRPAPEADPTPEVAPAPDGAPTADAAPTPDAAPLPNADVFVVEPPATVLLWNADGIEGVRQQSDELESGILDNDPAEAFDPWQAEVNELRQRMAELAEDFSAIDESSPSRSEP